MEILVDIPRPRQLETLGDLGKQLQFAAVTALTAVAKEAQTLAIQNIEDAFTIRGAYLKPSNQVGVRVEPATKDRLFARIYTNADWLAIHDFGGEKGSQRGGELAIPDKEALGIKEREIIPDEKRPRQLQRRFVLNLPRGAAIFQRTGKGRNMRDGRDLNLKRVYTLRPRVKVDGKRMWSDPIKQMVLNRFEDVFHQKLVEAVRTAI